MSLAVIHCRCGVLGVCDGRDGGGVWHFRILFKGRCLVSTAPSRLSASRVDSVIGCAGFVAKVDVSCSLVQIGILPFLSLSVAGDVDVFDALRG